MISIEKNYDLVVIGGGINGTSIARDAALRGLKVLLLEKDDYASGASSKTSKLIHGGLRYLEQGALTLVKESIRERNLLLKNAPHLVKPLEFLFPVYKGDKRPLWMVQLGLCLYDFLDSSSPLASHRKMSQREIHDQFPFLKTNSLRGGFLYYDAQMQDHRLVIENVLSAREHGAHLLNYTEVTGLLKEKGKIYGVCYKSSRRGLKGEVSANIIVSACGAWSNEILALDIPDATPIVRPTKGVHLVIPKLKTQTALILSTRQDGRIFFLMPWGDYSLLGTTDTDYQGDPNVVTVEDNDVNYLLTAINQYLSSNKFTKDNVIASFAGLRPLRASKQAKSHHIGREHLLKTTTSGIIYVVGGKYTTARKVAEETVDIVISRLKKSTTPCMTHKIPLYGGLEHALSHASNKEISALAEKSNITPGQLQRLFQTYGSAYPKVLDLIANTDQGNKNLCPHHPHMIAELIYAITEEQTLTLEDWFLRRTWLGYSRRCSLQCVQNIANHFAKILDWTNEQTQKEIHAYVNSHQ